MDNQENQQSDPKDSEEEFTNYLKSKGINEDTQALLAVNGFIDKNSLSVMEISDVNALKVKPLAQKRLLERLLKDIQTEKEHDTGSSNIGRSSKIPDVSEIHQATGSKLPQCTPPDGPSHSGDAGQGAPNALNLSDLIPLAQACQKATTGSASSPGNTSNSQPTVQQPHDRSSNASTDIAAPGTDSGLLANLGLGVNSILKNRADLNPLVYLSDNRNIDYYDVTDFVPQVMESVSEETLFSGNGSQIMLKSGPRKPKLETVSPMMWTAASARIMSKLMLEGKLSNENVCHYLSYTVKVATLAQRYQWQSVLLYDREYRRAQAAYNFLWGSDVPHLISVHLVPRTHIKPILKSSPTNVTRSLCKLYNHSVCTYQERCKFLHKCNICQGAHPQSEHK